MSKQSTWRTEGKPKERNKGKVRLRQQKAKALKAMATVLKELP